MLSVSRQLDTPEREYGKKCLKVYCPLSIFVSTAAVFWRSKKQIETLLKLNYFNGDNWWQREIDFKNARNKTHKIFTENTSISSSIGRIWEAPISVKMRWWPEIWIILYIISTRHSFYIFTRYTTNNMYKNCWYFRMSKHIYCI